MQIHNCFPEVKTKVKTKIEVKIKILFCCLVIEFNKKSLYFVLILFCNTFEFKYRKIRNYFKIIKTLRNLCN